MKNIVFNKTENFVGRNTSDHAWQIFCSKSNCETMYHWFYLLEITVVKIMNNLNALPTAIYNHGPGLSETVCWVLSCHPGISWSSVTIFDKRLEMTYCSVQARIGIVERIWISRDLTCSWVYYYLCNQYLSPLKLWVLTLFMACVLDTTLCDKVCQWLATGRWFSLSTLVSYQ